MAFEHSPLKIAYLCLQATTEGQASHAHVHEIIHGLEALGHEVDLHEPRYAGKVAPRVFGRLLEFARIQFRLIRNLRAYDVLYVRGHPLAWPVSSSAMRVGLTTIQECNGPYEDFVQAWPSARVFAGMLAAMARLQFREADAVVTVTPQLAEWVARESGQTSVHVVPNGANVDLFNPNQQRPEGLPERYAVFFGALQPWQGVQTILDATREPGWPEGVSAVFVGDGQLADAVRKAADERPERVRFLGKLPYHSVPPVVANAVVALVGFSGEHRTASGASPLKLFESMACGVPVIGGELPGQAEVIRDVDCGRVVEPITPSNLAAAVAEIASDPEMARAMGQRARTAAVQHHSWQARANDVDGIMDRALEAARATSDRVTPPYARGERHIAYLSLQAVVDGQDTWAAVTEIIKGVEQDGWTVDRYFPHYKRGRIPGPIGRLVEMSRVQLRLARHMSDYDSIYVRSHPVAWPISRFARARCIPVVQECNGPYEDLFIAWPRTRLGRPLFEWMQRSQYRYASAIISVAQGLTEWLKADTGNQRVITNGNGANISAFRPDAPKRDGLPPRYAVFFGQFPPWQGIQTLLEAVRGTDWPEDLPVVFVGDGVMRGAVEQAAAAMPGRVIYIGRLPYQEVAQVAAHALVSYVPMVAPEREARFSPLKLYESMACGVAVVASDTIGISEVVQECDCGLLVPPGDAHAIVEATRRLLEDPELAKEMGRRGRVAAVEHYSWRARSVQRREVIENAIEMNVC